MHTVSHSVNHQLRIGKNWEKLFFYLTYNFWLVMQETVMASTCTYFEVSFSFVNVFSFIIGGSRGGRARRTPPHMEPNSFVFAYIFTEKCPRQRSMPPLTGARPPTGNPGSATVYYYDCIAIVFKNASNLLPMVVLSNHYKLERLGHFLSKF